MDCKEVSIFMPHNRAEFERVGLFEPSTRLTRRDSRDSRASLLHVLPLASLGCCFDSGLVRAWDTRMSPLCILLEGRGQPWGESWRDGDDDDRCVSSKAPGASCGIQSDPMVHESHQMGFWSQHLPVKHI